MQNSTSPNGSLDPKVRNIAVRQGLEVHVARSSHEILESARTIAVVGASRDPNKAGGSVPEGLQRRGVRIIPINPFAAALVGEHVYRAFAEGPDKSHPLEVS